MSAVMERPTAVVDSASGRYVENITSVEYLVGRLVTIHQGSHLGYYEALADCGPLTYVDLASHTGIAETTCLLYTSPSPRDGLLSRMPSSA